MSYITNDLTNFTNSLLVSNLIVNQPQINTSKTFNDLVPEMVLTGTRNVDEIEDYVNISNEAVELAILDGIYSTNSYVNENLILSLINKDKGLT